MLAMNPETVSPKADPESGANEEPLENPNGLTQPSSSPNEPFTESPNSPSENSPLDKHASQDWNEETVSRTDENGSGRIDRARIGTNARKAVSDQDLSHSDQKERKGNVERG